MASESNSTGAAAAPKTKSFGYNPLRWFTGLSTRVQLLVLVGVVIAGIVLNARRQQPPRTAGSAATSAQAQQAPEQPQSDPIHQRFTDTTPSQAELEKLGKAAAKGVATPQERGVPDAVGAMVNDLATPEGDSEMIGMSGSGVAPAGAPYAPRGKRIPVAEVMGVFAAPARSEAKPARTAPSSVQSGATSATAAELPAATGEPRVFAPFGRLVKCKLYNTLDSLVPANCPIIALVMQDVEWNGHVIIPALTEVYGYVDGSPKIDAKGVGRLYDTGQWTLVLPKQTGAKNGREWVIKGRAMDRRETVLGARGEVRSWSTDDAAPGMIGYTISTLDNELVKGFAAQFFSDAAKAAAAVGQTQQPAAGMSGAFGATQAEATARNAGIAAAGAGVAGSLDMLANRITDELKNRGFYVRVPGGKEFYLFVEQTLDPQQARVGARGDGGQTK